MTMTNEERAAENVAGLVREFGGWMTITKAAAKAGWSGSPEGWMRILCAGQRKGLLKLRGTRIEAA
jgi:hypothetical protein